MTPGEGGNGKMTLDIQLNAQETASGSYTATGTIALPVADPEFVGSYGITPLMTLGDLATSLALAFLVFLNVWAIIRRHA